MAPGWGSPRLRFVSSSLVRHGTVGYMAKEEEEERYCSSLPRSNFGKTRRHRPLGKAC